MDFKVGAKVREMYVGYVAHCEHHNKPKGLTVDLNISGLPASVGLPIPRALWKAKKGKVLEVRERWFFQSGHDVLIQWEDGQEEWRLADQSHLELL